MLVYEDTELLDVLTRAFESRGFDVSIAATAFAAWSQLESGRPYDVIVAGWDTAHRTGVEVYEWVLKNRYHLRCQFVFLADSAPEDFDDLVQGRCLLLRPDDVDEIVRVTEATALHARLAARRRAAVAELGEITGGGKLSLLLVDDEPLQLTVMKMVLSRKGFDVTPAESGEEAIAELQTGDYDVILSDWYMGPGSGGDLYDWVIHHRPHLAERCVFMSAANPQGDCARRAPGCPLLPKGQDSTVLVRRLLTVAGESRASH